MAALGGPNGEVHKRPFRPLKPAPGAIGYCPEMWDGDPGYLLDGRRGLPAEVLVKTPVDASSGPHPVQRRGDTP